MSAKTSVGYFTVFCVLVGLAGGAAGLWAACSRNTFAAKLFFLSWAASLALRIVSLIVESIIIYHITHHGPSGFYLILLAFMLVLSIYFLKVISIHD